MTIGFMNRRLKQQFSQKMQEYRLTPRVNVRPLSLLTVEDLENILEYLGEITLPEVLDEYARAEHQPLSTFDDILKAYLKGRRIDHRRRYEWSVRRCKEVLDSVRFKTQ
jgi:hypothetical protein